MPARAARADVWCCLGGSATEGQKCWRGDGGDGCADGGGEGLRASVGGGHGGVLRFGGRGPGRAWRTVGLRTSERRPREVRNLLSTKL